MKKILVLFLVLFLPLTAFAEDPLSQEVLDQAKLQAGLFLELKNALGLAWMDDYNAYLEDPVNSPQPAWATSVQVLINDSYLSETFPTDFVITPTGQEVKISRTITSQAIKDVLPIYLPSVSIVGNTVSLLVQRPEQWVAWQAGLLGKVSRDGSDNPDILPNSVLDFGKSSEIKFVNNDGKITGVNSLIYKTQELDSRFVNVSGDNMTGDLTIKGNKAWHAGNDGTGSGLDADKLDGQEGAFYRDASNLNAGKVPTGRLSGSYNIDISGRASVATNADYASNSDKLDGKHASDFALSGHSHGQYVQKSGDTMTGNLNVSKNKAWFTLKSSSSGANDNEQAAGISIGESGQFGSAALHLTYTGDGYAHIGMGTVSTAIPAYEAIRLKYTDNIVRFFATPTVSGNSIWHAGNDGAGSGMDADLLDGQHGAFYQNASNLSTGVVPVARLSGTYGISITGNAATATNADKLDGYHHDAFVKKAGDTMTGVLTAPEYRINDANTKLIEGANNSVRVQTSYGYTEIGPQNTSHAHFMTDRADFYFNKPVLAESKLQVYATNTYLTGTEGKIAGNTVWHAGNDGSGSGLDADLLDGAHLSEILGGVTLKNVITYSSPGTYTFNKSSVGNKIYRIVVKCWGGGGGGGGGCHGSSVKEPVSWMAGGNGGASKFGSYMTANGGYGGQGATRYGGGSPGGGGTASGGEENLTGGAGEKGADNSYGGKGGNSPNGGSGGVRNSGNGYAPGGGGGGGSTSGNGGGGNGGGGGGYCKRTFSLDSLPDSTQVVVGGGGAGGSPDGGGRGGSGAPGRVVIECWGL